MELSNFLLKCIDSFLFGQKIEGQVVSLSTLKPIFQLTYWVPFFGSKIDNPHLGHKVPRKKNLQGGDVTISQLSVDLEVNITTQNHRFFHNDGNLYNKPFFHLISPYNGSSGYKGSKTKPAPHNLGKKS